MWDKPKPLQRYSVLKLMKEFNYEISNHTETQITGVRGTDTVMVLVGSNTVATTVDHPLWGRNTLNRREVGFYQLQKILNNPRIHTSKGYRNTPLVCRICGTKRCYCPIGDPHYFCDHDVWQHRKPPGQEPPPKGELKNFTTVYFKKKNGKWKKRKEI